MRLSRLPRDRGRPAGPARALHRAHSVRLVLGGEPVADGCATMQLGSGATLSTIRVHRYVCHL